MIPNYWKAFVESEDFEEIDFEIPEEKDLSGIGADLSIMSEDHILDEMNKAHPGIIVKKDGFVAVGSCLTGSGDPYFININDGKDGPLYRIYHDSVYEGDYEREAAVVKVLESYTELKNYELED
jgi:hypothetical protein